ncbi:glycosyltransferase [Fulvivirga sp. 29W222]|uniref:Glycosyltransferase n=1 Tax=Fulvivirga marina TaxID=2494733 RepID=A0A937FZ83_9BACT|nr:galactosyltransferase-related protein [Fulvivirga marina]MBL6447567.1 glycosyltransferase [Fulvivirga marina]
MIITWRDRKEIDRALPSFLETVKLLNGEIIIVNFGGDGKMLNDLISDKIDYLKVIHVEQQEFFHKTVAANIGASYASNEILFFCDCDIILDPIQIHELCTKFKADEGFFGNLVGVTETEVNSIGNNHVTNFGYELRIRTADGRELKIVDQEEDSENGYRNAPGLLFVKKQDFLSIDGYNGDLLGWGWEDQDMISRLTLGAGLKRVFHGYAQHISHDDEARTGNYPEKDRWTSRDHMFRQALRNYDNNRFKGTYQSDIERNRHNLIGF